LLVSCAQTAPILVDLMYTTLPNPVGTIVFFSGGSGTTASTTEGQEMAFAGRYASFNYQTIGTMWAPIGWEDTGYNSAGQHYPYNIQTAAARAYSVMW
jgi:hypothetical protein